MKKSTIILLILTSALALTVFYQFIQFRKSCDWQLLYQSQHPKKANNLDQILFLNDIHLNYAAFSPKDHSGTAAFSAHLPGLAVLKGEHRSDERSLHLSGDEIIVAAWIPQQLVERYRPTLLELTLLSGRRVQFEVLAVPGPTGILDAFARMTEERLLSRTPHGTLLQKVMTAPGPGKEFRTVTLDLTAAPAGYDGVLLRFTPVGKKRYLRLKLKDIRLLNKQYKIVEDMPRMDYLDFGYELQRKLKSVFLRPGSAITYIIRTGTIPGPVIMDGYLGREVAPGNNKPVMFQIEVNGQTVLEKEVTKGLPRFKIRLSPRNNRLEITFCISGAGLAGALGNICFYRPSGSDEKRHVVFYLIDALRADKGGITQPLMESQFKNGAIFTSAYANATRTADSLPVIFSGKFKRLLVDHPHDVPFVAEEERLLAEYFKSRGYITAAFINNPWLFQANASQGFDFIQYCWVTVDKPSPFPSPEEYANAKYGRLERYLHQFVRQNKNKPLFIYIHTMEPHVPYETPRAMRHYSAGAPPAVLNELFEKVTLSPVYPSLPGPTPVQLKTLKALYKDQVLAADTFFKKIHAYLEMEGVINPRTLTLLASDHGERFYEHKSWIHGPPDIYNEVVRVPLMLKGPGITAGVYNQNVQLADIYPTVVEWLGGDPPNGLSGRSLLNNTSYERAVYIDGVTPKESIHVHYAYIHNNQKVIVNGDIIEVYLLDRDPGETLNLAGNPEYKELVARARVFYRKLEARSASPGKSRKKGRRLTKQEKQQLKTLGYIK